MISHQAVEHKTLLDNWKLCALLLGADKNELSTNDSTAQLILLQSFQSSCHSYHTYLYILCLGCFM